MSERVTYARTVAHEIGRSFQARANAGILTGSAVTCPDTFRKDSDVDVVIFVDDLQDLLSVVPFFTSTHVREATRWAKKATIHGVASQGYFRNVLTSINIVDAQALRQVARLQAVDLVFYRTTCNAQPITLGRFKGRPMKCLLRCDRSGAGFISYEPVTCESKGTTYIGILPDALLAPVEVLFDKGQFAVAYHALWRNAVALARASYGSAAPLSPEILARSLVRSKAKRGKLSKDAITAIETLARDFCVTEIDPQQPKRPVKPGGEIL